MTVYKKPDTRSKRQKFQGAGGAGSKEDRGGKTSRPAAISRSMHPPAFKAKRDVKSGQFSSQPKSKR